MRLSISCLVLGIFFIASTVQAKSTKLIGSYDSGGSAAPATFTITKTNEVYDFDFPKNLAPKWQNVLEKLIEQCKTYADAVCEIEAVIKKDKNAPNEVGYILDVTSIKKLK